MDNGAEDRIEPSGHKPSQEGLIRWLSTDHPRNGSDNLSHSGPASGPDYRKAYKELQAAYADIGDRKPDWDGLNEKIKMAVDPEWRKTKIQEREDMFGDALKHIAAAKAAVNIGVGHENPDSSQSGSTVHSTISAPRERNAGLSNNDYYSQLDAGPFLRQWYEEGLKELESPDFVPTASQMKAEAAKLKTILDNKENSGTRTDELIKFATNSPCKPFAQDAMRAAMYSHDPKDRELLFNRLSNKENLLALWNGKRTTANDLATWSAESGYFSRMMSAFDTCPAIKAEVCKELLKTNYDGYNWNVNEATDSMRLEALRHLIDKRPSDYEATLANFVTGVTAQSKISLTKNDAQLEMKRLAQEELTQRWSSDQPKKENECGASEFLKDNRVQRLVNSLKNVPWNDNRDHTASVYCDWEDAKTAAQALKQEHKDDTEIRKRADQLRQELDAINRSRGEFLDKHFHEELAKMGIDLPGFQIKICPLVDSFGSKAAGRYVDTKGEILLSEEVVSRSMNPGELTATALHELTHHEQNLLIIENLAELENKSSLKVRDNASPDLLQVLKDKWKARLHATDNLSDHLVEAALHKLKVHGLTKNEEERSRVLLASYGDLGQALEDSVKVNKLTNSTRNLVDKLEKNGSLTSLLGVEESQIPQVLPRLVNYLGIGELPEEIKQSLKQWQEGPSDKVLRNKLNADLSDEVKAMFTNHLNKLDARSRAAYLARLHEDEAYKVEGRAVYYASL
jgi:hypothetical protein